jgi:hypothetical protein
MVALPAKQSLRSLLHFKHTWLSIGIGISISSSSSSSIRSNVRHGHEQALSLFLIERMQLLQHIRNIVAAVNLCIETAAHNRSGGRSVFLVLGQSDELRAGTQPAAQREADGIAGMAGTRV